MTESYFGIVNDVNDALILFEAARQKVIPMVTTRLTESSRKLIRPGSIFVWEIATSGMRRWTDGHTWSPSRYHNHFFTYHEIDDSNNEFTSIHFKNFSGSSPINTLTFHQNETTKPTQYRANGLIKRTTSMSTTDGRKFQLVNYVNNCSQNNLAIPKINECPMLSLIPVPVDYYFRTTNPTTGGNSKHIVPPQSRGRSNSASSLKSLASSTTTQSYIPYTTSCINLYKPICSLNNNVIPSSLNTYYNPQLGYQPLGEIAQSIKEHAEFSITDPVIPIFQNQNDGTGSEFDFVYGFQPMNNLIFNSNIYQFQADT